MPRAPWLVHLAALALAACFVDVPLDPGDTAAATTTGDTAATTTSDTGETTTAAPICGNGLIEDGEICDSGSLNGSLCTPWCTLNACGDGYLGPGEACDDGNTADADGCSAACLLEICGDGVVQPWESCDDGNAADGDGCSAACLLEGCGDGVVQRGEECDDGNQSDDDACTSLCKPPACGDGLLTPSLGEACDDGPQNADHAACTAACAANVCGDGLLHAGVEVCDDGDLDPQDGCSPTCQRDARFAFVTSQKYHGALGGLTGADKRCQDLAAQAGLPGLYLAWLADDTGSPVLRFPSSQLPTVRTGDHALLAESFADLTDGQLATFLNRDETGAVVAPDMGKLCGADNMVWTNVDAMGKRRGSSHCKNWSSPNPIDTGRVGLYVLTDYRWTDSTCNNVPCAETRRLYCFEIDPP